MRTLSALPTASQTLTPPITLVSKVGVRIAVGLAHQRLRGEMEDDVGLGFRHGAREVIAVAHVAFDVA